jgi:hypothetical protein
MLTPALPSPNERGKHWLQAKVQQLPLTAQSHWRRRAPRAPPHAIGAQGWRLVRRSMSSWQAIRSRKRCSFAGP